MNPLDARISENVQRIRDRIAEAALRSGRSASEVTLVAVTKYVGEKEIRAVVAAGCTELGESRPQQIWQRTEELQDLAIHWHLIGHLQSNKIRRTLPLVSMIQSVDSLRLADALENEAKSLGLRVPILLEINVAHEEAKTGLPYDEAALLLEKTASGGQLDVRGLMCMAEWDGGPDAARRDFVRLRQLRDHLRPNCPPGVSLEVLSMGMSGDYEIAVEEGATIVRVGSALFEGIDA